MNKSFTPLTLIIANLISVAFALVLNFLAVSLPINNKTTAELSDAYPNLFVPAGFTFSIWGIIYLLMLIFLIYQAYQYKQNNENSIRNIESIGLWFLISGMANGTWILAWHYEFVFLSLCIMLILLYSLLKIYLTLDNNRPHTLGDNLAIRTFLSVYLGWISVATIANVTTFFVSIGWTSFLFSPSTWTIVMICTATLLGILMVFKKQDIAYPLVIAWALYGILSKQSTGLNGTSTSVATTAKYALTMLLIYTFLNVVGRRSYILESK
jgi:hypothetical protein